MNENEALKRLLIEANEPGSLGITQDNLEEVPEWVEAGMAYFLQNPFQKQRPAGWRRALRYAAGIAAAIAVAMTVLYHTSPAARAWMDEVIRVVMTWREENTMFHFSGKQPEEVANSVWRPEWLPEGYEEYEVFDLSGATEIEYRDGEGRRLILTYFPVQEGYMLDMDNEHSDYREITLNGQAAYLFESNTEGKNSFLVFFDETGRMAFRLAGLMPGKELIQIAESMEQKN